MFHKFNFGARLKDISFCPFKNLFSLSGLSPSKVQVVVFIPSNSIRSTWCLDILFRCLDAVQTSISQIFPLEFNLSNFISSTDWKHVFADVTVILKTKRWVCCKKADDNLRHLVTHIVPPGSQEHLGVKLLKVSFWPRKKASMTTFGQIRCQTTRDSCLSCCFSQRTRWSLWKVDSDWHLTWQSDTKPKN